jgi:serine/threonine protein kinase
VYRATHVETKAPVAIKILHPELAQLESVLVRFDHEVAVVRRLRHRNIVRTIGNGELSDGRPYLVMDWLEGLDLAEIVASRGPLSPDEAHGVLAEVTAALEAVHSAGVVHRDLKPTNVMWRRDRNGDDRITLVDFGIAVCKLGGGSSDVTRLTQNGLIGTPHYMSPEQAHGEQVDARSDIYALGCLLFELVTGDPPFDGSGFEVLLAHLGRPAPIPSERIPSIPPVMDRLIGRLMAKKPDDRPQSADAVVTLIDEALDALGTPATAGSGKRRKGTVTSSGDHKPIVKRAQTAPPVLEKKSRAITKSDSRPSSYDASYEELPPPPSSSRMTSPTVTRSMRARWAALGAVVGLTLAAAGFVAVRIVDGKTSTAAPGPSGADSSDADNNHAGEQPKVFKDDGEIRLKAWWRDDAIGVGKQVRLHLDLRNKLNQPIGVDQLVVTVEDPQGKPTGTTARPRRNVPEQYSVAVKFTEAGKFLIRVFPPETQSSFDFVIDVPAN